MEHQRVRIADIAEELGTSTATVSADSYGGGFKAGEYLRQIGHKKCFVLRIIIKEMKHGDYQRQFVLLETSLVKRSSTAPPCR